MVLFAVFKVNATGKLSKTRPKLSSVFNSTHFALLNRSTVGTCECLNVFVDIPYVPYTPARNLLKDSNREIIGRYQIQMCINSFAVFLTCGTNTITCMLT